MREEAETSTVEEDGVTYYIYVYDEKQQRPNVTVLWYQDGYYFRLDSCATLIETMQMAESLGK